MTVTTIFRGLEEPKTKSAPHFPVAAWWLRQRHALGAAEHDSAEELVGEHRAHLHPLEQIVAALVPHFRVGTPLYGPYLYRWDLDEALRRDEEDAIARAEIPAVGARRLARRTP